MSRDDGGAIIINGLMQITGVVSNARDKRRAISGVIAPRSFIISDNVFLETPRISAISLIIMDKGKRQSSFIMLPG